MKFYRGYQEPVRQVQPCLHDTSGVVVVWGRRFVAFYVSVFVLIYLVPVAAALSSGE